MCPWVLPEINLLSNSSLDYTHIFHQTHARKHRQTSELISENPYMKNRKTEKEYDQLYHQGHCNHK